MRPGSFHWNAGNCWPCMSSFPKSVRILKAAAAERGLTFGA